MDEPHHDLPAERDTSTMVFLSLFLLVLAFFILLTALSEVNEKSSLDIIQEVKASFSGDKTTNLPTSRQRLEADADASAHKLSETLQGLFDRDLPGIKTALNSDRVLQVRFPEYELFSRGRPTVRRTRLPLVRQIAGLIRTAPQGIDHRLELSIPDPAGPDTARRGLTAEQQEARALAIARLGHLAASFAGDGAAAAEMSIALRPVRAEVEGDEGEVLMRVFTLVEAEQNFVSFAPSRQAPLPGSEGPVLNLRLDRDAPAAAAGGGG